MKTVLLFFYSVFFLSVLRAQETPAFMWPLDTPCILTGNYGELRPNHFHAGIDLSTGGRIKKKVYAAESGYVSRIRVSSGGYGNCLYITHPNSKVTVYAHLNNFNLKIASVVKEEQMKQKSFEVELLPSPGLITVKRGEVIGLSGNSGGSTGPHLHFEIRDEKSETPLNPLSFYKIPDPLPPMLETIAFYDLSDTLNPMFIRSAKLFPASVSQTFVVHHSELGLAFGGYDLNYQRGNKNNIYKAELYFDGRLMYAHRLRAIDFADSRYVNEFSEMQGRQKLQKCFVPTLFPPRLYDAFVNKGRLSFNDTLPHEIELVMSDEMGNVTEQKFNIRSAAKQNLKSTTTADALFVHCTSDFVFEKEGLKLFVPGGTFYRSVQLKLDDQIENKASVTILPELTMRSAYVLSFRVPEKLQSGAGKLVLQSGSNVATGVARNDSVYFYLKNTGTFNLLPDLEPPLVRTSVSPAKLQKMRRFSALGFYISDKLSGISSYNVYVNNKWVIAEYDAKYSRLTYYFDEDTPAGPLNFRVEVSDRVGNIKKFSYRLVR